jgi:hypothetical protein
MRVYLKKQKSKSNNQGLFPVGFEIHGILVNAEGVEIESDKIEKNLFLKLENTVFDDKPFQFSTDTIQKITKIKTQFVIDTVNSVWEMEKIS